MTHLNRLIIMHDGGHHNCEGSLAMTGPSYLDGPWTGKHILWLMDVHNNDAIGASLDPILWVRAGVEKNMKMYLNFLNIKALPVIEIPSQVLTLEIIVLYISLGSFVWCYEETQTPKNEQCMGSPLNQLHVR